MNKRIGFQIIHSYIMGIIGIGFLLIHFFKGGYAMELSYFWWGMFSLLYSLVLYNSGEIKKLKGDK